jgi:hypothetical protein
MHSVRVLVEEPDVLVTVNAGAVFPCSRPELRYVNELSVDGVGSTVAPDT